MDIFTRRVTLSTVHHPLVVLSQEDSNNWILIGRLCGIIGQLRERPSKLVKGLFP